MMTFLLGMLTGVAFITAGHALMIWLDFRRARQEVEASMPVSDDPRDVEARKIIDRHRARIGLRRRVDPEWVTPLTEQVPEMVREIAAVYHPDHEDPLLAPGVSEFARAVELTACDVADMLQRYRVGRLVDLSAHRARQIVEAGRKLADHESLQWLHGVYAKAIRPAWRVLRFKSPFTWGGLLVKNAAVRTVQVVLVGIVGRRAIQLYGGRLSVTASAPAPLAMA